MISKIIDIVTCENVIERPEQKKRAVFFTFLTLVCASFYWHDPWFGSEEINFRIPNAKSTIFGLAILIPLYIRRVIKMDKSLTNYKMWCFLLNVYVFSLLVQILIGSTADYFKYPLLTFTITTLWIGMRSIAGLSVLVFFVLSIFTGIFYGEDMKILGFGLISFGMLSLMYQSDISKENFFLNIKNEFKDDFLDYGEKAGEVLNEGVNLGVDVTKKTTNVAASAGKALVTKKL